MFQTALAQAAASGTRRSMLVLTDLDTLGPERRRATEICAPAVRLLAEHDVPVVFVSGGGAAEVVTLQKAFALRAPFVCEAGRRLQVPGGYFEEPIGVSRPGSEWNVIEFSDESEAPDLDRAVNLLTLMMWRRREQGLVVALTDRDPLLLNVADVRIVVRNRDVDQSALRTMTDVYFTEAEGAAGWAEAIIGQVEV
jgi:predicted mannosyl-3-phosphoglycerate phosphatase (HAD superfamily)